MASSPVTYKNYRDYLDSTVTAYANAARRIQALIRNGELDPKTGKALKPKSYTASDKAGQDQGAKIAANQKKAAAEKKKQEQIKAWEEYDKKKAANDRTNGTAFPGLKEPAFPRPLTAENIAGQRYQAQVPSTAKGGSVTETVSSDYTFNQMTGQNAPTSPTKPTTPTKPASNSGNSGSSGNNKPTGPSGPSGPKPPTVADKTQEAEDYAAKFFISETLFQSDPELQQILADYIKGENNGGISFATLQRRIATSKFVTKNSAEYRQRQLWLDQWKKLGTSDGTTPYEQEIQKVRRTVESNAKQMGAAVTQEDINKIADQLWLFNQDSDQLAINSALSKYIKFGTVAGQNTLSGAAKANMQNIVQTMYNNGFGPEMLGAVFSNYRTANMTSEDPNADIATRLLQDLANGADLQVMLQRVRDVAGTGYGDAVKNLLGMGIDLSAIADPYVNAMATSLEINPAMLSVNDPTIRMALSGDKSTMNLYDFTRALRKDDRWQYTKDARDNAYSSAYSILRNFGFTG